jgi:hypothetical protein
MWQRGSRDWLAGNQDNVAERSKMWTVVTVSYNVAL